MELKKVCIAISLVSTFALSGCFSSSSDSNGSEEPADQGNTGDSDVELTGETTGVFVDSVVSGLEYKAEPSGLSGTTDDDGLFAYEEGDTVTFSVGQIRLGQVSPAKVVSPLDIVGVDDTTNDKVTNIARFLQSIDDDGFANNGIQVTESSREFAENQNPDVVTFDDTQSFESSLKKVIGEMTKENRVQRSSESLVTADEAQDHLNKSIRQANPTRSCDESGTSAASYNDLDNKHFAWITEGGEGFVVFNEDNGNRAFKDYANDNSQRESASFLGAWSLEDDGKTLALTESGGPTERFPICAVDDTEAVLMGSSGSNSYLRLAPVEKATVDNITGNYRLEVEGNRIGRIGITENNEEGGLEATLTTDSGEETESAEINDKTGNLQTNFSSRSLSSVRLLKGSVPQKAVYIEEDGDSFKVGKLEALGPVLPAENTTFSDNTIFTLNDDDEIVILSFDSPSQGRFEEYGNDAYSNNGRIAERRLGDWQYANNKLTLDFDGDDAEKVEFSINESDRRLYAKESGTDATNAGELTFLKASRVSNAGMVGEYDVSVPTENTSQRSLKLGQNGECLLEGDINCTWEVANNQRRIDITLTDFPDIPVYIWKAAGTDGKYAYLQLPTQGAPEPGVMTEQ